MLAPTAPGGERASVGRCLSLFFDTVRRGASAGRCEK
jgi:hypothetical protein